MSEAQNDKRCGTGEANVFLNSLLCSISEAWQIDRVEQFFRPPGIGSKLISEHLLVPMLVPEQEFLKLITLD